MRSALLADIHGNLAALEALELARLRGFRAWERALRQGCLPQDN